MKCSKCGNIILPNWKFCYSCGAMISDSNETLSIEDNKPINYLPIYISNLIITIINIIILILLYTIGKNSIIKILKMSSFNIPFNINMIFKYAFIAIIIISLIYRFYSMSYQFILKKASMYWFLMLIPGINVMYLGMSKFKLAYGNYGFFIIYLLITTAISLITIPLKSSIIQLLDYLVQFIILIILECKMAKNFNASKVLTVFFAPIMYPLIAFDEKYEYFCDN